jgi:hypothetical protein
LEPDEIYQLLQAQITDYNKEQLHHIRDYLRKDQLQSPNFFELAADLLEDTSFY